MHARTPVIVLFCSSVLWGLSWWPLKALAARGLSGVPLILAAYGSVGLLLLPVLWAQVRRWWPQRRMLALIVVCGGSANVAFGSSMIYGDVIRCMALFYLLPVWGVIGGSIFLGERICPTRALAVLLALAGAFFLLGGTAILQSPPTWVDAVAVFSGFAFAMTNLCFRASPALPVPSKVAALFLGCLLFALLLLAVQGQGLHAFAGISTATLALALLFGTGGLLLGTSCTQWAVTRMEAGRSAIVMVMELVSAVASAALIAGDRMSTTEMAGGALILAATVMEAWFSTGDDALSAPA